MLVARCLLPVDYCLLLLLLLLLLLWWWWWWEVCSSLFSCRFFESHLLMYVRWMRACTYDSLNLSPPLRREVSQQALCFVLPCVGAYMLTCSWKCLVNPKSSISVSPPCFWPPSLQSEALMSDGMSWVSPFLTHHPSNLFRNEAPHVLSCTYWFLDNLGCWFSFWNNLGTARGPHDGRLRYSLR